MISSHFENNPSNIFQITTKVLIECKRGLDCRISNCKLGMHAKCYDELRTIDDKVKNVRNRRNESLHNGTMIIHLDEQKLGFHYSLNGLQVHIDGAWYKLKMYSLHSGIGNYPKGCIVSLEPFQI